MIHLKKMLYINDSYILNYNFECKFVNYDYRSVKGRFTEDGSFIGQYGPKGRPEETPPIPSGTMATYV